MRKKNPFLYTKAARERRAAVVASVVEFNKLLEPIVAGLGDDPDAMKKVRILQNLNNLATEN